MILTEWSFEKVFMGHLCPKCLPKGQLEKFVVEYLDVFAKHRFDEVNNTELKIKLTTEHAHPVYVQGPPAPIHLRNGMLIELTLFEYFNIIITLSTP